MPRPILLSMKRFHLLIFSFISLLNFPAQLIVHPSATQAIFVDIAEDGDELVMVTVAEIEMNLVYHQRIYRLDHNLNGILDSVNIDYTDYIQFPDVALGNLVKRNGSLEYVGIAGHLTNYAPEPFLNDSAVFIRLSIEDELSTYLLEKVGLLDDYLMSTDFVYDETNQRYVGTAFESIPTYRVISVDTDLGLGDISDGQYHSPDPEWNINFLSKVILPPFSSTIYPRFNISGYDVLDSELDFISNSYPPIFDPVYHLVMSQSMKLYGDRIFTMAPEGAGSFISISKYTFPWDNGSNFMFPFPDSSATGSVFRGLDMNEDHDLLLGVHLKAEGEDYAKALKVIKCDTLGNILWQRTLTEGLDVRYVMKKVLATSDGGAVIAAERYRNPSSQDADGIILYRLDENGLVLDVNEPAIPLPQITLYPNPVKDHLFIINASIKARYHVMDMRGALLKEGFLSGGSIDMSDLGSGLYLIELVEDGSRFIQKVLKAE